MVVRPDLFYSEDNLILIDFYFCVLVANEYNISLDMTCALSC